MAINFYNSEQYIKNLQDTPGIITNNSAFKPPANSVAYGTIFIENNTGNIYQSYTSVWGTIGGGGSSLGLQDVINNNNVLNTNNTIDSVGYGFLFNTDSFFKIGDDLGVLSYFNYDIANDEFSFFTNNTDNVFKLILDTGATIGFRIRIGDFANQTNGTYMQIIDKSGRIEYYQSDTLRYTSTLLPLTQTGSGTQTTEFLRVLVDGVQYVIPLYNEV